MFMHILNNIVWWLIAIWMAGYAAMGPQNGKSLNSPITWGEVIVFLLMLALLAGPGKLTARIASRKGGSYVGWSYYGLMLPYIALPHALLKRAKPPVAH